MQALQTEDSRYGSGAAEDEIADGLGIERALLFSTDYMTNLAIQQALMQPDTKQSTPPQPSPCQGRELKYKYI